MIRVGRAGGSAGRFVGAERRPVVAVLTGSSRDLTVARLAAEHAERAAAQLLLAVPIPTGPFAPRRTDLHGSLPRHAEQLAGRVVSKLEARTPVATVAVPYSERSGPSMQSRRITSALVDLCRRLAARELVATGAGAGTHDTGDLTEALAGAASTGQLRSTGLVVVGHAVTAARPRRTPAPQRPGRGRTEPPPMPRRPPEPDPTADALTVAHA